MNPFRSKHQLSTWLLGLYVFSSLATVVLTVQDVAPWAGTSPHLNVHSDLLLFCASVLLACAFWVMLRPRRTLSSLLTVLLGTTLSTLSNGLLVVGTLLLYLDNIQLRALWLLTAFAVLTTTSLVIMTILGYRHHQQALRAERQAQQQDPLTGLLNRAGIKHQIAERLQLTTLSIVLLDLNNLKLINDSDGHGAGDAYIRHVGQALNEHLPAQVDVGRWGGDEFLLSFPVELDADVLMNQVLALVAHPKGMPRAFSYGTALAAKGTALEQALALADQRMYEQKLRDTAAFAPGDGRYQQLQTFTQYLLGLPEVSAILGPGLERCLAITGFDALAYFNLAQPQDLLLAPVAWCRAPGLAGSAEDPVPVLRSGLIAQAIVQRETCWDANFGLRAELSPKGQRLGIRSALIAPVFLDAQVVGVLGLVTTTTWKAITAQNRLVLEALAMHLGHALERQHTVDQLRQTLENSVRELGVVLEVRDLETAGHTDRVAEFAHQFGQWLGVSEQQLDLLRLGAYLHDVGKLGISDSVLLKPGRLDAAERQIIETHTVRGAELVERLPSLPPQVIEIVLSHHERWDGTGYPHGLSGEAIPFLARLFALCDVYDALTSRRPYKEAWSQPQAVMELQTQAGRQFDPALTTAFLAMLAESSGEDSAASTG